MARIFVSHGAVDIDGVEALRTWLVEDNHEVFLDSDPGLGIEPGSLWEPKLYSELTSADILLCVVTPAFRESQWCFMEVGIGKILGCEILPVRIGTVVHHPLLDSRQYVNCGQDPPRARSALLEAVRSIYLGGRVPWRDGENPYPGLTPFTASYASAFFGRESEIRLLAAKLRGPGEGRVLAIIGSSGCGKSSLLAAGLLPAVTRTADWLALPVFAPGTDPVRDLARAFAQAALGLRLRWSIDQVEARLAQPHGVVHVVDDLLHARGGPATSTLLITVDQAEQLFSTTVPEARSTFLSLLRAAMRGRVRVVVALRSEFLDDLRDLQEFSRVPIDVVVLGALRREMVRLAIEGPARVAGIRVSPDLVARMVTDAGDGEVLPDLALLLRRLADGLSRGESLSAAHYADLGGVAGALSRRADEVLADAVRVGGSTERSVVRALVRMVTLDGSGRRTRRPVRWRDLPVDVHDALAVFVDARLLVRATDAAEDRVDFAHESLLISWQPLADAITMHTLALHTARSAEQAAADWIAAGRNEAFLWSEERLRTATGALRDPERDGPVVDYLEPTGYVVEPNNEARIFLTASADHLAVVAEIERNRAAERARAREQEAAERATRAHARSRRTIVALTVLVLVTAAVAAVALRQRWAADQLQLTGTARALVASAEAARTTDPRSALALGVAATKFTDDPSARSSLASTVVGSRYRGTYAIVDSSLQAVAVGPGARAIAGVANHGTAVLWTGDRDAPAVVSPGSTTEWPSAVFAPNGTSFVTSAEVTTLWTMVDPLNPQPLALPETWGTAPAYSFDSRKLALVSRDGIVLVDISDPLSPRSLGSARIEGIWLKADLAFDHTGDRLAALIADSLVFYDVSRPAAPREVRRLNTGARVTAFAFDPTRDLLVTGDENGTLQTWSTSGPDSPRQVGAAIRTSAGHVLDVAVDPTNGVVVVAGANGVSEVPLDSDLPVAEIDEIVYGVDVHNSVLSLSPDGRHLGVASGGKVVVWEIRGHGVVKDLAIRRADPIGPGRLLAVGGRTLIGGDPGGTLTAWELGDPRAPRRKGRVVTGAQEVAAIALDPTGRTVAVADDTAVRLSDANASGEFVRFRPESHAVAGRVGAMAFSPDGGLLAVGVGHEVAVLFTAGSAPLSLAATLPHDFGTVTALAFDQRGVLAALAGGVVALWDVSAPEGPRSLPALGDGAVFGVTSMTFVDGAGLVTAQADGAVRSWGDVLGARTPPGAGALAGQGVVRAMTGVPGHPILITTGDDGDIRFWDTTAPGGFHALGPPVDVTADITRLAVIPDGSVLIASGSSGTRRYDLAPLIDALRSPLDAACALLGRGLDESEWHQFVGTQHPYERTCPR